MSQSASARQLDVLVVGAGFSGMYLLHLLRGMGLSVKVIEAGDGVGGTWFWNRYPGARCDVESMSYCYTFDPALQREWQWSEKYPAQPEILRYLNHVADRYDLRRDIQLETRVTAAHYDERSARWQVRTDRDERFDVHWLIMATGCLSTARMPEFPGRDSFKGASYHTRPASAHARPRTPGPGDWLDHFICFEFDAGRRVVGGTNKGFILYADVPE